MLSDLNTSIRLFRKALDRCPSPHHLRSDSLRDLAVALAARFILTNEPESINEACSLYGQVFSQSSDDVRVLPEPSGRNLISPLFQRSTESKYKDALGVDLGDSEVWAIYCRIIIFSQQLPISRITLRQV